MPRHRGARVLLSCLWSHSSVSSKVFRQRRSKLSVSITVEAADERRGPSFQAQSLPIGFPPSASNLASQARAQRHLKATGARCLGEAQPLQLASNQLARVFLRQDTSSHHLSTWIYGYLRSDILSVNPTPASGTINASVEYYNLPANYLAIC